jgi:hypothetical protein
MDYRDNDSSPSFGETRAADLPGSRPPEGPHGSFVQTPASGRTAGSPRATPPGRPTPTVRTSGPSMSGGTQFCGTCGARISGAEAFCGQCGTPVGQSGDEYTSALGVSNSAPSRYHVGTSDSWTPAQADELTEAYVPTPPYGRSGPGLPYAQSGFGAGPYTPAARDTRTTRVVIGVVCLVGSLASAVAAIVIAILK